MNILTVLYFCPGPCLMLLRPKFSSLHRKTCPEDIGKVLSRLFAEIASSWKFVAIFAFFGGNRGQPENPTDGF